MKCEKYEQSIFIEARFETNTIASVAQISASA
jgi:hypothetical protein